MLATSLLEGVPEGLNEECDFSDAKAYSCAKRISHQSWRMLAYPVGYGEDRATRLCHSEGHLYSLVPSCLSCAHSLVCITGTSGEEVTGAVAVEVPGRGNGVSEFNFAYQVPKCQVTPSLQWSSPCGCLSPFGFAFTQLLTLSLPCLPEVPLALLS